MPFFKSLIEKTKNLKFQRNISAKRGHILQLKTLKKLLLKAQFTDFGKTYNFENLVHSDQLSQEYRDAVPLGDYIHMLPWWERSKQGQANVTWPGKIENYAVSSGTTDNSSKYIPVSKEMTRAIHRGSLRQLMAVVRTDAPKDHLMKNWLMMGGSTDLEYNGVYHYGDLSGITTKKIPFFAQWFSKPEPRIKQERDWNEKIQRMTREAINWDVGIIAGVPAWVQMLFENILSHYKISNIHEIWPNLEVYIHGGVSIKPYKKSIDKLLGRPIKYFENYLASEGFMAFQHREDASGMRLLFRNGIYFEFVPFNDTTFNENGELIGHPKALTLEEVDEKTHYAFLISTCSGAWRYLVGDVVRFTNLKNCEIEITGRTKSFLSLCGEHLSVDNMNRAIELTSNDLSVIFSEYTVAGIPHQSGYFAHQWYIGYDGHALDSEQVKQKLDFHLKQLNDDYRIERTAALRDIYVQLIPNNLFIEWMEKNGKFNAQTKFPRVLKNEKLEDWTNFMAQYQSSVSLA